MTAALEGGEWSAARPGHTLPPGKTRYPMYRRLGGSQGRSRRAENLVPTGIRSRTVQPVVSRYTDWATGPTVDVYRLLKSLPLSPNTCRRLVIILVNELFAKPLQFIKWRERTNKMQLIRCLLSNFLSQHVSGIIMPIIRRIRPCRTTCGVLPGCVGCGWLWSCGAASWPVCKLLFDTACSRTRSYSPDDGCNYARNMLTQNVW